MLVTHAASPERQLRVAGVAELGHRWPGPGSRPGPGRLIPPVQGIGLLGPSAVGVEDGEILDGDGHVGVVRAEVSFLDGQGAAVELFCLVYFAFGIDEGVPGLWDRSYANDRYALMARDPWRYSGSPSARVNRSRKSNRAISTAGRNHLRVRSTRGA